MEYKIVEEREHLPEHLRTSSKVVEVRYGKFSQSTNHTESVTLGQITFCLVPEISYLWMLNPPHSSRAVLRQARRLWPALRLIFSPILYAHAAGAREASFLTFFSFTKISESDGVTYFREDTHGR